MSENKSISYPRECLVGQRFGRLHVVCFAGRDGRSKAKWKCDCDCGSEIVVDGSMLKRGKTTSCGCYARELLSSRNHSHGMTGTRTHRIWMNMRQRCQNANHHAYAYYGGRGITVCDEWNSFDKFLKDMGECPSGTYSIDRIDGSKGYERSNCRWATAKQQARNTRSNVRVSVSGNDICLKELSERDECNVPYSTLTYRVRNGIEPTIAARKKQ